MDLHPSNASSKLPGYIPVQSSNVIENKTCSHLMQENNYQYILFPVIYMIIFVAGTLGNTVIIVGLTCCVPVKSVANIYIVNLAMADLSFVATLPFWAVDLSGKYKWIFGNFWCKFCATMSSVNMYASIFLLTCLSIDRYYSIVRPMKALKKRTLTKAKMITAVVWILAFAMSTPTMYFRQTIHSNFSNHVVCTMVYPPNSIFWPVFIGAMKYTVGFVIPSIVQGICYCLIYKIILALGKMKQKRAKTDKILKVVVAMVLAFLICWLPFHIFDFLKLLARFKLTLSCKTKNHITVLIQFTVCIAFSNSCINPFLYYFASKRFQTQLKRSIKRSL
ncbi:type-1 angiotensin II receptor A-like [Hyperolius riggenbachi]|uniref:type-1 angiotensin II receptor A-like n=1 Tax=Hyperolius riggenbachi TaxID=752182 RepID=UPI0035A35EF7